MFISEGQFSPYKSFCRVELDSTFKFKIVSELVYNLLSNLISKYKPFDFDQKV
jgi:hypothetical protein